MNKLKLFFTNKMNFLRFGLISFAIGILLGKFGSEAAIYNFLTGLFMGLSLPLNIFGIYQVARSTKTVKEDYTNMS